jgi:hypothetical protein
MKNLYESVKIFCFKKFPDASNIDHLRKLNDETMEAIETPFDIEEYADCLIALLGAANKSGFNYDELLKASKEKLFICEKRKWKKLKNGTYQHIS